ncbi:Aste57867_12447 [Aphanomyces stellatus]|uniref:Aste57867_12447 protein n=1 Tax=Aphanomyces stellatus TaxID=120398 RepID=A0A485KWD1_9STRA|nr:hypothetical protein As57867_012401 [Aphanomyces stellatus]VFT89298.1 Aste57867_12447 [Aphanomyces stellatus]
MEASLKDLWATSYDGWINPPGFKGVIYSRPLLMDEPLENKLTYPESILSSHLFAFGAWNPMGQLVTQEENNAAHEKLKASMKTAAFPEGCWVRPSFGFSVDWREPGFLIACPPQHATATREAVLRMASDFMQGAIYEYEPTPGNPSTLVRKTVHCLMSSTVDADVIVVRSDRPSFANAEPFGM